MKLGLSFVALATFSATAGFGVSGSPVVAATTCPSAPPSSRTGNVTGELRQASGLASLPTLSNVLFTHNDRGIRDHPETGEDTTYAAVWAINPQGDVIARLRLVHNGNPIPYYDTEAIAVDHEGRIVLADTGTNVDQRVTVALYRFALPNPLQTGDVEADIIPIQYFKAATGGTPIKLNVEAFAIDASDAAWFIARTSTLPFSYTASSSALQAGADTGNPVRAVRSSKLTVNGPMTDASISPNGSIMMVKTNTAIYEYQVDPLGVAKALKGTPCQIVTAPTNKAAGFGEAIVVDNGGNFFTVAESSKSLPAGKAGAAIWSFHG